MMKTPQFTIRFALTTIAIVCITLVPISRYHREERFASAVQNAGGTVFWAHRRDEIAFASAFNRVEAVHLPPGQLDGQILAYVASLRSPTQLVMRNTSAEDDGLKCISSARSLRVLDLEGTGISDSGLQYLRELKHLRELSVNNTAVSYEALLELCDDLPLIDGDAIVESRAWAECAEKGAVFFTVFGKKEEIHVRVPNSLEKEDVARLAQWIPGVARVYVADEEDDPVGAVSITTRGK